MKQPDLVAVQRGLWIDEQRLAEAGLGDQVRITVRPGEIRVVSAQGQQPTDVQDGWRVFESLGQEAQQGTLVDPSTAHDRYLYGRTE